MLSVDELRSDVTGARRKLFESFEGASGRWDLAGRPEADGEAGWSPREAAEHALRADVAFAQAVADAIGTEPLPGVPLAAVTPDDARSALARVGALVDAMYSRIEAGQLANETRYEGNVAGVLQAAARHLQIMRSRSAGRND